MTSTFKASKPSIFHSAQVSMSDRLRDLLRQVRGEVSVGCDKADALLDLLGSLLDEAVLTAESAETAMKEFDDIAAAIESGDMVMTEDGPAAVPYSSYHAV